MEKGVADRSLQAASVPLVLGRQAGRLFYEAAHEQPGVVRRDVERGVPHVHDGEQPLKAVVDRRLLRGERLPEICSATSDWAMPALSAISCLIRFRRATLVVERSRSVVGPMLPVPCLSSQ